MLTLSHIREKLKVSLGEPVINVELDESHYDTAISRAVDRINRHLPNVGALAIPTPQRNTKFRVDDKVPGVISVDEVEFTKKTYVDRTAGVSGYIENPFVTQRTHIGYAGYTMADHAMREAYYRDAERIFSGAPEWYTDWETVEVNGTYERHLYLYIRLAPYVTDYWQVSARYTSKFTADDDPFTGVGTIPAQLEQWLTDYALAHCKVILGRILRKHGGVPTPQGGTMPLDGGELVQEGMQEIPELERDILRMQRTLPPIIDG